MNKIIEMKKIALIICFLLSVIICALGQQEEAWQDDLDYLVERIEIMHPDPYAFYPRDEFYKLKERLFKEIPKLSDVDIVLSISEMLATLQDGHTRWAFEHSDPQWLQQSFHVLPVIHYAFEDGIYIMAGLKQYQSLVGLKVIQIGEIPIDEVTAKLGKMWSHDNQFGEKKFLYYTLSMAEMLKKAGVVEDKGEITMVLQNGQDEKITVQLPLVDFFTMAPIFGGSWYPQTGNNLIAMNQEADNPLPLWLRNPAEKFWFDYIEEEKIMFLEINSLNFPHGNGRERSPFGILCDQFFETFDQSGAEKMVIDIRTNTGGNHVELPLLEGIMARPDINRPDRLFLITGRVTFSAAVHLTTILKRFTNITIIGEPTSGRPNHYGAVRAFRLPNHPQVEIHCSVDYYQDSEPFDFNIANMPDIITKMSAAEYQNNIDPAMRAVKNYDRITDFIKTLTFELEQAYADNRIPGIKKEYYSNKQLILESCYNPEEFFTGFYYNFLSNIINNTDDLIDYLLFALSECPESIDLSYSLAVQLESAERINEAKEMYERCLELNPAHHYAKMRFGLIELK